MLLLAGWALDLSWRWCVVRTSTLNISTPRALSLAIFCLVARQRQGKASARQREDERQLED